MKPLSFNGKALRRTVDNYWYTADELVWIPFTFTSDVENFSGTNVWHHGNDTYYTNHGNTYKLDSTTGTWNSVNVGLSDYNFAGLNVWHDGSLTYASVYDGTNTYVYPFNGSTNKFGTRILQDYKAVGKYVWTAGSNIYFSFNPGTTSDPSHNLMWNRSTQKWVTKTWNFTVPMQAPYGLSGAAIWHDYNGNTYTGDWSNSTTFVGLYKLNVSNSTWVPFTWDGYCQVQGIDIWTDYDGTMHYGNGANQYYLDRSTGKWVFHGDWLLLARPTGEYVWTDGSFIFHSVYNSSYTNYHYVLKR